MRNRDHYHVYVVELSKDVLFEHRFVKANPDYVAGMPCVYPDRHHRLAKSLAVRPGEEGRAALSRGERDGCIRVRPIEPADLDLVLLVCVADHLHRPLATIMYVLSVVHVVLSYMYAMSFTAE